MIFAIFAIIAYAGALLWVVPTLVNLENQTSKQTQPNIKAVFSIGLVAVVCHFASLTTNFILEGGSQCVDEFFPECICNLSPSPFKNHLVSTDGGLYLCYL